MAKAKAQATKTPAAPRSRTARQHDAERWNRILIIGGIVAVIIVAIGVIAFGWYQTQIRPLNKTVLVVGNTKYTLATVVRRMKLERHDNPTLYQNRNAALSLPNDTYDRLDREGRLLEGSGDLSIAVTDAEVADEIRNRGGLDPTAEATAFAVELRRQIEDSQLHKDEYLDMVKADLLEKKVRNYFIFLAPKQEAQVRAQYLFVTDKTTADDSLARIRNGEDFKTVADEVSLASTSGPASGELDWTPRGGSAFVPRAAQDWLFDTAQPNEVSDVISSGNLYYVVKLLERNDNRALGDDQRQVVGNRNMGQWLTDLEAKLGIKRDFTDSDITLALDKGF